MHTRVVARSTLRVNIGIIFPKFEFIFFGFQAIFHEAILTFATTYMQNIEFMDIHKE